MAQSPSGATRMTPKRPPVAVLVIGVVFIAFGLLDIWLGVAPMTSSPPHLASDDLLVASIGIVAVVGAIYVLKGYTWARWLLTAWMALQVVLSIHQPHALLGHVVIFGLILGGLFYPGASVYFRQRDG